MEEKLYQGISVIIPTYNEKGSIEPLIRRIHAAFEKIKLPYEIIFVDDNSTDGTFERISELSKTQNGKQSTKIKLLRKKGKNGKSYSIHLGIAYAKYDLISMIDGDLQYPPEVIPQMVLDLKEADIIVANRKEYNDSILRKSLSKTFRLFFGKFLFDLDHDIQSGLKVFKRTVSDSIRFIPSSPWTFDLEFLHRAKQAGFKIKNFDIKFTKRKSGESKINFVKQTFEIGTNAIFLRTKKINPVNISPEIKNSMLGAGIGFKRKKYITHTTMNHAGTAINTLTFGQKLILFLIILEIIIGFIFNPLLTLQIVVAFLSFIYFLDVLFNLFLIMKSLTFPQEISSSKEDLEKIDNEKLPIYTILCPLYREVKILPQFLDSISKLSWPKEKLDVILLLEEDDKDTIESIKKMDLPSYVRALVVPNSFPKTKPKACNYGLSHAKGEYLVIYDAEDIPEPMQLKKAYLGFQKVDNDIICLQAKLNYYNPHQNLLTRFFTAEYSLWFDVTLPGLQSINTTIPLGGTSNHFKVKNLIEVEGWDPFNVTEDADLGMRLFKKGFRTAIIDSTTLEEANSRMGNWLRQRSRWIKGYMQTYLVHVRESLKFAKDKGKNSLIFQLLIGGKIAFILINPFLWLATISYFTLYAYVGPAIESLYPAAVFYMAVTSLVFGNFLFLYYYMIGVAKKGQWNLMKFVFLVPLYWLLISVAAFIALYQLIFKPHYWEKTVHGFHLKTKEKLAADVAVEIEKEKGFYWSRLMKQNLRLALIKEHFAAFSLIAANTIASILAFAYSAYLGRVLTFEDFALVGLINGLISLVGIIFGSLGTTMIHRTGYLMGKFGEETVIDFWAKTRRKVLAISIILSIAWILLSPFLIAFFNLSSIIPLILFSPILMVALVAVSDRGLLFSKFNFKALSILIVTEPLVKLLLAIVLVFVGLKNWAYATIPISALATFIIGWRFVYKNKNKLKNYSPKINYSFPFKFFLISIVSGVSSIIFLNLDVILAKHYLEPSDAGLYTLTSLIGKMIFFLGSLASPFTVAFVSRNEGANKDSRRFLNLTVLGTLALTLPAFIIIFLFGEFILPLMFGPKALSTLPFIQLVSFGMVCFSIARVYSEYYLAKKYYSLVAIAFSIGLIQLFLLEFFHSSVWSFVNIMSSIWISYLAFALLIHAFSSQVKTIENNVADIFGLFTKLEKSEFPKNGKLRILIFNWRDIEHKWAGGAEVYIHELAKRWVKNGNSVTLFSGKGGQKSLNENIDGIQIYRRGGYYTVYFWAFVYYIFKFRGKYDVIIDSENGIPFFTPLYAKENKFLLIHHVHQEVFRKSLVPPFSWLALFLEARLMPFIYRNVQIITVSPSSKEAILKYKLTKKEPIIIYNGVDLSKFKPGQKSQSPSVLYVGRLQYYKSLNVFIKSAKNILEEIPNIEFIIAGEGGEKENLIKYAKNLGILEKIKFLGKVSEDKKISLFQKAWVFVNPSFMEGWGITTIEANACGTPAVASNVSGLKDSIKNPHTGILVKYGDSELFAKSITKLIKDSKLRYEMSLESVKWSKNFSWEKSAEDFLSKINNMST